MNLKCITCCGEAVQAKVKQAKGEDVKVSIPNDAITLAPVWQQQIIGGNMVMACVTVPVCEKHLSVEELSAVEQAIRGGLLLPGMGGA